VDHTKTSSRPAEVTAPRADPAPVIERFDRPARDGLRGAEISWRSALATAGVWLAAMLILDAVAPPADPDAVVSGFELSMTLAYTSALMVGAVGLALRQRIGVMATVAGGGLFVVGSVSCWMGGHVGSWIAVQAVLGTAMMLFGTGVLRRS